MSFLLGLSIAGAFSMGFVGLAGSASAGGGWSSTGGWGARLGWKAPARVKLIRLGCPPCADGNPFICTC